MERPAQRPPQRLALPARQIQTVKLDLVQPQPHERVR
jgi:hypothetical protein